MPDRCERCGRFIGEDCAEGVDWSKGTTQDGDVHWTGRYYCANGTGCNDGGVYGDWRDEAMATGGHFG